MLPILVGGAQQSRFGLGETLEEVERRRVDDRRRILTALLLLVASTTAAGLALYAVAVPEFRPSVLVHIVPLLALLGTWRLARTRHDLWAARIAVLMILAISVAAGLSEPAWPAWWAFGLVGVLVATVASSPGVATLVAAVAVAVVLGVELWRGHELGSIIGRVGLHAVVSPVLLALGVLREQRDARLERGVERLSEASRPPAREPPEPHEAPQLEPREARRLETIGRVAGAIAHDFDSVLTVISGASSSARGAGPRERGELLDAVDRAAERGSKLVRQLLGYSRKQDFTPQRIELVSTVEDLVPMLRSVVGTRRLVFAREVPGDVWVDADPAQVEQVVVDLAVDAGEAIDGQGRVEVRVGAVSTGPVDTALADVPCAYLVVSDDGVGMDPQATPEGPGREAARSLGLSAVRGAIVEAGGHLEVQSAPGEGSSFRVYLPLVGRHPAPTPDLPLEAPGRRPCVLVVDDDEMVLRMATRLLTRSGFEVLSAHGPEQARALFEANAERIEVVLSDVVMPGTDGIELSRELLERSPGLKVVLMSGYSADAVAKHGFTEGQVELIKKPFSRRALLEALGAIEHE